MKQKIFYGLSIFAIIAGDGASHAATTSDPIIVNNKTSQFNNVLSEMGANATDSSNSELAETIRRQRALLDAQADKANATGDASNITTANVCDAALRKCMAEKCGADFTKCASDSTTVWGNKMDACRRNTKCTGHEYTLLAPEILADRNANIETAYYKSVIDCGDRYNSCIFGICGKTLEKCLSKSAGDSAIAKCKSIADACREQDSGLSSRVMSIFGDMRTVATADAQKQEKRLYELRDLMRNQCTRFGAMFDERTLDCVYTVNFFAGTDNTLMASKKLYSGDTFQCTPDWFGVDITTYMENAQRLTRSQTSASAAAMGAGLGTAASLWTSGAVMRGIDTQNAEKQAKEACKAVGGEWVSAGFNQGSKCDMRKPKADCERQGGTWDDKTGCSGGNNNGTSNNGANNPTSTGNKPYETLNKTLTDHNVLDKIDRKKYCKMFEKDYCPQEYCRVDSDKCIAKTDSSTGGGSNQGNSSNDCDNICNEAIKGIQESIQKSPYAYDAKTTAECADQCLKQIQPICQQLNGKEYTSVGSAANGSKYNIKNAHAKISYFDDIPYIQCAWDVPQAAPANPQSGTTGSGSGTGNTTTTNTNGRVVGGACIEKDIKKLKPYGWTSGTYIQVTEKANSTTVLKARCETKKGTGDNVPCNCKATACDGDNGYEANSNGLCVKKKTEQKPTEKKKESPKQTTVDPSIDGIGYCYYAIGGGHRYSEKCDVSTPGEFGVVFPDMTIYGDAVCSNVKTRKKATKAAKQSEINLTYNTDHDENKGKYCYCRVIDPRKSGVYYSPWISGSDPDDFSDFKDCAKYCARGCSALLFGNENFRRVLFGE